MTPFTTSLLLIVLGILLMFKYPVPGVCLFVVGSGLLATLWSMRNKSSEEIDREYEEAKQMMKDVFKK